MGTGTAPFGISYGIIGLVTGCAGMLALTVVARRRRRLITGSVSKQIAPRG